VKTVTADLRHVEGNHSGQHSARGKRRAQRRRIRYAVLQADDERVRFGDSRQRFASLFGRDAFHADDNGIAIGQRRRIRGKGEAARRGVVFASVEAGQHNAAFKPVAHRRPPDKNDFVAGRGKHAADITAD
jgi:hypothetical protein